MSHCLHTSWHRPRMYHISGDNLNQWARISNWHLPWYCLTSIHVPLLHMYRTCTGESIHGHSLISSSYCYLRKKNTQSKYNSLPLSLSIYIYRCTYICIYTKCTCTITLNLVTWSSYDYHMTLCHTHLPLVSCCPSCTLLQHQCQSSPDCDVACEQNFYRTAPVREMSERVKSTTDD